MSEDMLTQATDTDTDTDTDTESVTESVNKNGSESVSKSVSESDTAPPQVSGKHDIQTDIQTPKSFYDFYFSEIPTEGQLTDCFNKYLFYGSDKTFRDEGRAEAKNFLRLQNELRWPWVGKTSVHDIVRQYISNNGKLKHLFESYIEPDDFSEETDKEKLYDMLRIELKDEWVNDFDELIEKKYHWYSKGLAYEHLHSRLERGMSFSDIRNELMDELYEPKDLPFQ